MSYLKRLNIRLVEGEYKNPVKGQVREPKQIYGVFKEIKDDAVETLIAVYLTNELKVITYNVISVGGESLSLVL